MSISTRRGDDGTGQLMFGPRVSKASLRIEAYGTLDELGSHLGVARAWAQDDPVAARIESFQRELFLVGAELATPPDERRRLPSRLEQAHVDAVETQVHEIEALPGILSDWALPGATTVGAALDVARTVCRRAERVVVALVEAGEEGETLVIPYLNRLSDLLWLYARWYELRAGRNGALRQEPGRGFSDPTGGA